MKKILLLILLFFLFTFKTYALEFTISSKNVILYNLDSGEVLYEKNSEEKVSIASLTKIMTAIVSLENIQDLDEQVILINDDFKGLAEANLVTAGFTKGQAVTYRDLLYGLILPSGADAAKALARCVAGSEEEFIKLMNKKVQELDLKNTNFSTVIGLDDENNYSSAKDIASFFKYALENEEFKTIISTSEYKTSDGKLTLKSTIQSNATRYEIDVPYILGGKTGTTTKAGLCLATIATSNNVNYMLITLGALYDKKAPHHLEDAEQIYDYFIQNYSNQLIVDKSESFKEIKVKYTKESSTKLFPNENIYKYLENSYAKEDIKLIYDGKNEISYFDKDKQLGTLKIYYQNDLISEQQIFLNENIHFSFLNFIKEEILIIISVLVILLICYVIVFK